MIIIEFADRGTAEQAKDRLIALGHVVDVTRTGSLWQLFSLTATPEDVEKVGEELWRGALMPAKGVKS